MSRSIGRDIAPIVNISLLSAGAFRTTLVAAPNPSAASVRTITATIRIPGFYSRCGKSQSIAAPFSA
jgi:hypothetical protein